MARSCHEGKQGSPRWSFHLLRKSVADLAAPFDVRAPPLRSNSSCFVQILYDFVRIKDKNVTLRSRPSGCDADKTKVHERVDTFPPGAHTSPSGEPRRECVRFLIWTVQEPFIKGAAP